MARSDVTSALKLVPASGFRGGGVGQVDVRAVAWSSIGGLAHVKAQLQRAIEWPMRHPHAFKRLAIKRSKGVLLYGPPGCGKTTLVRAAASATAATFLSVSAATLFSPFVGDSEKYVVEIFRKARLGAPTVLFIDEIDSLVSRRGSASGGASGVQDRVLSALLTEMDGVGLCLDGGGGGGAGAAADVIVVGATNRPDMLDAALCRPGRLDQLVFVPPPDGAGRLSILASVTAAMPLAADVDLPRLAAHRTQGFSGADLEALCREAALQAMTADGIAAAHNVRWQHFQTVLTRFAPTVSQEMIEQYDNFAKKVGGP